MATEFITTIVIIFAIVFFVDKIYDRISLSNYSPIWEYFAKAFLYGFIAIVTLFYGKDSMSDVSMLEWAIIAVSAIEGTGNYINYVKESKMRKEEKGKSSKNPT